MKDAQSVKLQKRLQAEMEEMQAQLDELTRGKLQVSASVGGADTVPQGAFRYSFGAGNGNCGLCSALLECLTWQWRLSMAILVAFLLCPWHLMALLMFVIS